MNSETNKNSNPSVSSSSAGLAWFAWLWVGLPLAWGFEQTFVKAMGLFH